jgi:DNA-binding MarR family transcriptional regulator
MSQDPSAQPITVLLRQLGHRASAELTDGLAAAGFTDVRPVDTAVFKLLGTDGARLTDLASRTGVTKQALTFVIDRLVRNGYVERIPDPSDQRAKLIRLTDEGARASGVASATVAQLETRWRAKVGASEWSALRGTLIRLVHGVT